MSEKPRFFFALRVPEENRQPVIAWRAARFSATAGYPVAADNLSIPLAYLGELSSAKCQALQQFAGRVRQQAFALTLDDAGHRARSGIIWLGSRSPSRGILQLAAVLRAHAARNGCYQPPYPFHPQVIILRHVIPATVLPVCDFNCKLHFTHFTLMQSYSQHGRYHQRDVAQWPLYRE